MEYTNRGLRVSLKELKRIVERMENAVDHDCMSPVLYVTYGDKPKIVQPCVYQDGNSLFYTTLARDLRRK